MKNQHGTAHFTFSCVEIRTSTKRHPVRIGLKDQFLSPPNIRLATQSQDSFDEQSTAHTLFHLHDLPQFKKHAAAGTDFRTGHQKKHEKAKKESWISRCTAVFPPHTLACLLPSAWLLPDHGVAKWLLMSNMKTDFFRGSSCGCLCLEHV